MLLTQVTIGPSPIHGLGIFAARPLAAGEVVWRFQPGFDRTLSAAEFEALPSEAQQHLRHFGSWDAPSHRWCLNGDLAIFMNHSLTPNTGAPGHCVYASETVALRDIAHGEEMTCDYRTFDSRYAADFPH